jgi:nucleoside-diphosphate-sugar epimerase
MVELLQKSETLDPFAVFHMEGHWDADGTEMINAIRRAAGNSNIRVRRLPWPLILLLSPMVPLFHELAEMRYLWNLPVRMDNERLKQFLGAEPHTPLDTTVRDTLIGFDCLKPDPK